MKSYTVAISICLIVTFCVFTESASVDKSLALSDNSGVRNPLTDLVLPNSCSCLCDTYTCECECKGAACTCQQYCIHTKRECSYPLGDLVRKNWVDIDAGDCNCDCSSNNGVGECTCTGSGCSCGNPCTCTC